MNPAWSCHTNPLRADEFCSAADGFFDAPKEPAALLSWLTANTLWGRQKAILPARLYWETLGEASRASERSGCQALRAPGDSERLLHFVTLLDRDVEIIIRPKAEGHASGVVSVRCSL